MMLTLGPTVGIFCNAVFYLPLVIWLIRAPYGRQFSGDRPPQNRAVRGLADIVATIREVRAIPILATMVALAGSASFFLASGYQAQMPSFALDLGHGDPGTSYAMLLGADASGALLGGILLESSGGVFRPRPRTAMILAIAWALSLGGFASTRVYPFALALLFLAGFFELSFSSMTQTLVQVNAPNATRGRVLGLYNMASMGLRAFSGVTVGLVGSAIGIHVSLAVAAGLLILRSATSAAEDSSRIRRLARRLHHHPGDLLDELGRDGGGDIGEIAARIVFDDIGADDRLLDLVDPVDDLPRREAARLAMGDAGCIGRIEPIEIQGDINRRREIEIERAIATAHLDHLDTEPLELRAMMIIGGAQADLDQPVRQSLLHDPCKRRSMRARIALIGIVDVGMRIEMQDGEPRMPPPNRPQHRMGDRVVAADRNQGCTGFQRTPDRFSDLVPFPGVSLRAESDVAVILEPAFEIDAGLGPAAVAVGIELAPDQRRRFRGSFQEG